MIPKIRKLLKRYNAKTLSKLSKQLKISPDIIKNVSSGRTDFCSLHKRKIRHKALPKHSENLAELIGITLGDGNIFAFRRCQRLTISCNGSYKAYTKHIKDLVRDVFDKEPSILKRSKANCHDVCLYMQDIDRTLDVPIGNKIKNKVIIPAWIFSRKQYLKRCLKGLFETDGCYGFSKKFHIEYMEFCNKSESLRQSAYKALTSLGYSPQIGNKYVRLARKDQVRKFIAEMDFIRPFPSLKVSEA